MGCGAVVDVGVVNGAAVAAVAIHVAADDAAADHYHAILRHSSAGAYTAAALAAVATASILASAAAVVFVIGPCTMVADEGSQRFLQKAYERCHRKVRKPSLPPLLR